MAMGKYRWAMRKRQLFRCNGFRFRIAHLYFPIAIFCPSVGKDVQPTGKFILLPWLVEDVYKRQAFGYFFVFSISPIVIKPFR